MSETNSHDGTGPIFSTFADDEDFGELLQIFSDSVEERKISLIEANKNKDFEQIKSLAHQLKGAGGGYGFPGLTTVAKDLEEACLDENENSIIENLDRLIAYIDRIEL